MIWLVAPAPLELVRVYTLAEPTGAAELGRSLARGDVNGDAIADLLVGAPGPEGGLVRLFSGGFGFDAAADWSYEALGESALGRVVASCDTDLDGFDELVVGDPALELVLVFPGWPTGPLEPLVFASPEPGIGFGEAVSCGDVDDNEIDDLVVGAPGADGGAGRVWVWFAGPYGLAADPGWTVSGAAGPGTGASVACLGDATGDDYGELAIGGDDGAVVFHGTDAAPGAAPDLVIATDGPARVAAAGDIDGDGVRDLLVGAPTAGDERGRAELHLGGPAGVALGAAWSAEGSAPGAHFGAALAGLPDLDGDGRSELAVVAPDEGEREGAAYVYRGGDGGAELAPCLMVRGGEADAQLAAVATAGDVDWDGRAEVAFGVPGRGEVWLYAPIPPSGTTPSTPPDSGTTTPTSPTTPPVADSGGESVAANPGPAGCGCVGVPAGHLATGALWLAISALRRRPRAP